MAGARSSPVKTKLAEVKEGIAFVVASEGGKIDASKIKDKYKEHVGKKFPTSVIKGKLTSFIKEQMNNDVDVYQEGNVNFIKSKTKRKDTKSVKAPVIGKPKSESVPVQHHSTTSTNEDERLSCTSTGSVYTNSGLGKATSFKTKPTSLTLPIKPLMSFDALAALPYENNFPSLNSKALPTTANRANTSTQYQSPAALHKKSTNHPCFEFISTSSSKTLINGNDAKVKNEVDRIIEELAKDHYIHIDLVKKRLFERYKVQKPKDLGNYHRVDDIPGIKELAWKQREVNASIQAFVMVRSVSTLHELSKYLASLYSEAQDYEDLKLGPLVKHPLVYEYFKFPSNLDPPEITTLKVMKYLKQFMTDNRLKRCKIDMQEFLDYLTEQMSCESPYELGVKISSIALMIKCIGRCQSGESASRREAEQRLLEEIAEEIDRKMSRFKKQLLGSNPHSTIQDPDALVTRLQGLPPVEVLQKLFEYCEELFQGKPQEKVTDFVKMCVSDKASRKLFQLALHISCQDLLKPVNDFQQNVDNAENTVDVDIKGDSHGRQSPCCPQCPTQRELLSEVKRWLTGVSSRSVDLTRLARVEDSVLTHYRGFTAFRDLGQGSFLQFLLDHKELKTLTSLSAHTEESELGVRKSDVIDFLQQCGVDSDKTKLLQAVRAQYEILRLNLDETAIDALIARARGKESMRGNTSCSLVYEACLVADNLDNMHVPDAESQKRTDHVGMLGYQDKSNVLTCLYQTPLLEDFMTWSEWHRVFAPIFGNLKLFLRKNAASQNPAHVNDDAYPRDLVAIETSTGSLLRITRMTSPDVFLKCAKRGDVIGTSGHLVSLVFQYGGVGNAPLALLASHMKEAFLSLNVVQELSSSEECVIRFAIRCLSRVPPLIRHALGMKIFIEPLNLFLGMVKHQA